jgi:hypothetical protein
MTTLTALLQGWVDVFLLEVTLVMAAKAGLFRGDMEQLWIFRIMGSVAATAFALFHRGVRRFLTRGGGKCFVAGIAELRLFLAEEDATDQAVGKVTLVAAFLLNGGMDIALFLSLTQLWMAIKTFFCHRLGRLPVVLYA